MGVGWEVAWCLYVPFIALSILVIWVDLHILKLRLVCIDGGSGDFAYGCTGGRQTDRCKCFNLRLMWRYASLLHPFQLSSLSPIHPRGDGKGELYTYLPKHPSNDASLKSIPPQSIRHPDYGFSVGRGAWTFQPGKWTAVAERVKLNTVGKADGEWPLTTP